MYCTMYIHHYATLFLCFISGLLSTLGGKHDKPVPPINLLADFAGGGLMCAFGIAMALLERSVTGRGQVVDSSMVEGAAYVGKYTTLFVFV